MFSSGTNSEGSLTSWHVHLKSIIWAAENTPWESLIPEVLLQLANGKLKQVENYLGSLKDTPPSHHPSVDLGKRGLL